MGYLLAAAGNAYGIRALTSVMSPATYGALALALTIGTFTLQVAFGPIAGAALRFYSVARESGRQTSFLYTLTRFLLLTCAGMFCAVTIYAVAQLALPGDLHVALIAWAAALAALSGISATVEAILNAARQRQLVAVQQVAAQWGRPAGATLCLMAAGDRPGAAVAGMCCAAAAVLVFQMRSLTHLAAGGFHMAWPFAANAQDSRAMWNYMWPICTWGVFTSAQLTADRWALHQISGAQAVGLYHALYQLGYLPPVMIAGLMTQLVAPVLFERAGDGTDCSRLRLARRTTIQLALLIGSACAAAILIAFTFQARICALVLAPPYRHMSPLLPVMIASGTMSALGQTLTVQLLVATDTRRLILPKIGTAALSVLCAWAGAMLWSVPGVIAGSFFTSTVYCCWIVALWLRQDRRKSLFHRAALCGNT